MTDTPIPPADEQTGIPTEVIVPIVALVLLTVGSVLIALAFVLAAPVRAEAIGPLVQFVRDVTIIATAAILIVIGAAVVVLIVQVARLVNLLNNEIKPLIDTTSETLNTVRGTAEFLSKHMTDPVIEANSKASGVAKVFKEIDALRKVVTGSDKSTKK